MRPSGSTDDTHKRSDLREDLLVWHSLIVFEVRGHVGFYNDGKEIFADVGSFLQIVRVCCEDSFLLVGEEFLTKDQLPSRSGRRRPTDPIFWAIIRLLLMTLVRFVGWMACQPEHSLPTTRATHQM